MKTRIYLAALIAMITTLGVTGLVDKVDAAPDDSQRLRGLGDRVFLVEVELTYDPFGLFDLFFGVPVGTTFPNCYIFNADVDSSGNNWFESAFPDTVGFWAQGSVGAKTDYEVYAGDLMQWGQVTPAGGKGVLQLEATSSIPGVLEFFSVGAEVQGSDIDDCPAFPPPFTPPAAP